MEAYSKFLFPFLFLLLSGCAQNPPHASANIALIEPTNVLVTGQYSAEKNDQAFMKSTVVISGQTISPQQQYISALGQRCAKLNKPTFPQSHTIYCLNAEQWVRMPSLD